MFEDIGYGALGGLSWSVLNYMNKLRHEPTTEFKFSKFIYSGILGVVVGVVASQMKVDLESASTVFVTFGGTAILNEAVKWVFLKLGWTNPPTGKR